MRIRTTALACLLTVTAPALLSDAGFSSVPLAPGVAHAQDNITKLAREKFIAGVNAYDKGRFDEARTLFLQAYALKRHPAVLLNLGQSEVKSGNLEDGGNHLQQFLRQHSAATDQQKADAKSGIAEAQKRTSFAIVIVDADGAEISIDGVSIGKSPLLDPYFLKPGKHTAIASHGGKTIASDFESKRGSATPVTLNFKPAGSAVTPVPAPLPGPAPQPATQPAPYSPPVQPMPPPAQPQPWGGDSGGTRDESIVDWYTRKPVAWVLTGVFGVGLVGTIAFGAAAGQASANADSITTQINDNIRAQDDLPASYYEGGNKSGQPVPCGSRDGEGSIAPHPNYADACSKLEDNLDAYDTDLIGLGIFAAVGGAGLVGLVAYYFIDTRVTDKQGAAEPTFTVAPLIGPYEKGIGISGSF